MTIAHRLEQRPDVESSLPAAERALHVEGDPHTGRRLFEPAYQAAERPADEPAMVRAALVLFLAADLRAERSPRELSDQPATGDHLIAGSLTETIGVMLAIRSGRPADAETLPAACVVRGQAAGNLDAIGWYGTQTAAIRWYQGRLGELVNSPVLGTVDPGGKAARAELVLAEQEAAEPGMVLPEISTPRRSDGPAALTCRRDGRQWELSLGTRTTLVDDSVGMRSLATLIAGPGREIRAIDLAASPAPHDEPARDGGAPSDQPVPSGQPVLDDRPVLDDQAGDTYREHLLLLQAEIADLESAGAVERAAACRAERDRLVIELAAALRLGARTHRLADDQERARVAVGKAIRRALVRITAADPVIGDELRATVHTGVYCAYRPRR